MDREVREHIRLSTYTPLEYRSPHIRLLFPQQRKSSLTSTALNYSLKIVPLDGSVSYDALSYTWGHSGPSESISVDGAISRVSPNLFDALCTLYKRSTMQTPIWIDAICINQSDSDEKNQQVPLMRQIYSTARVVHVWLGSSPTDEAKPPLSLNFMRDFIKPKCSQVEPNLGGHEWSITEWFVALQSCKWFTRLWVLQEVLLAQDPVAYLGNSQMPLWDLMDDLVLVMKSEIFKKLLETSKQEDRDSLNSLSNAAKVFSEAKVFLREAVADASNKSIAEYFFRTTEWLNAFEEKDFIYGLLGILPDKYHIKPMYGKETTTQEVYQECAANIMRADMDLGLLKLARPTQKRLVGLPSWVPDFSAISTGQQLGKGIFQAKGNAPVSGQDIEYDQVGSRLTIRGWIVDGIHSLLRVGPSKELTTWWDLADNCPMQLQDILRDCWLSYLSHNQAISQGSEDEMCYRFWQAMTNDMLPSREGGVRRRWQEADFSLAQLYHKWAGLYGLDSHESLPVQYAEQVIDTWMETSCYLTKGGRITFAESEADVQESDLVVIAVGLEAPLIMRPAWDRGVDNFRLVSCCYALGFMNGEGGMEEEFASSIARVTFDWTPQQIALV